MKPFLILLFMAIGLFMLALSCTKNNDVPKSIVGKWNIKIDSFYVGAGLSNHGVTYVGQSNDYFNFSSDGHVYIKENSVLDTLTYTLSSNSILVKNFGSGDGKGEFQSLSTENMIIRSAYFYTPGGIFGRTVSLTR
jgi:hypothetical protein